MAPRTDPGIDVICRPVSFLIIPCNWRDRGEHYLLYLILYSISPKTFSNSNDISYKALEQKFSARTWDIVAWHCLNWILFLARKQTLRRLHAFIAKCKQWRGIARQPIHEGISSRYRIFCFSCWQSKHSKEIMSSFVNSHGYSSLQLCYLVLLIKAVSLLERNFLTTYSKKEKKNTVKACPHNGLGLFMPIFFFLCLCGI